MAAQILPFPVRRFAPAVAPIDWPRIERTCCTHYPHVPKTAVRIVRRFLSADERSHIFQSGRWQLRWFTGRNAPDPLLVRRHPNPINVLWLLESFERYGGVLRWGSLRCTVRRAAPVAPVRLLQPIPTPLYEAMLVQLGRCDYLVQNKDWQVTGWRLRQERVILLLINIAGPKILGVFDQVSGRKLVHRLAEGRPINLHVTLCHMTFLD